MIQALFADDRFKDFTIKGKDCEVKVHKAVLAISDSEYFRTLSNSSVGNSFVDNYVETDLDILSLNYLVNFIYGTFYKVTGNNSAEEYYDKIDDRSITFIPNFREIYSVIDRFLCRNALSDFKMFLENIEVELIPIEFLTDFFEICLKTESKCQMLYVDSDYLYDLIYKHNISITLLSKVICFNRDLTLITKSMEKILNDKNVTLEIFTTFCDNPHDLPLLLISKMFMKGFISNRTFNALLIISNYKLNKDISWYEKNEEETSLQIDYGIVLCTISDNKFNFTNGYQLIEHGIYREIYVSNENGEVPNMDHTSLVLSKDTDGWAVIGIL
jgi:hypothetical protein